MQRKNWKLSPSDFAFLWEECKRCFYLKVALGFNRPFTPFPKIFTTIAGLEKGFFHEKTTDCIAPELPAGRVVHGEKWVRSKPIEFEDVPGSCYINGRFDNVVEFEDGTFGVIDFKTAETKSGHVQLYSRQLHAYAHALENAERGFLALTPITRLGLCCLEPHTMFSNDPDFGFSCRAVWLECPRDDSEFQNFMKEVLTLLDSPDPPGGSPTCPFCQYRDTARRTGL